jgi:hypothetical protein
MIESVIESVCGVLDRYDKSYTRSSVTVNLNRWKENKGWLIELLRRHPNWNEEALAVIFDVTESREIDTHTVCSYKNNLFDIFKELDTADEDRSNFYAAIDLATGSHSKILSNDNVVTNIKHYTGIPFVTGQKTSRVINKICQRYNLDKHPEYNAHFARLADSLNPIKIKRKALLSVHPCDYLEMSNRDNSWTSCHCLNGGAYHGGALSYMNDECSMIFYTVDDDVEGEYYQSPKRTRQVFCFNSGILLQSRLYPNTDDEEARNTYRNIVQHTIADCLTLPNLWTLKRDHSEVSTRVDTFEDSLHYPDYDYECFKANVSILKDAHAGDADYILIGYTAYCINCSQPVSEAGSMYCSECADPDYYVCYACGSRVHEDNIHYVNGEYYCDECCSYCDHCQEYTTDDTTSVHDRCGNLISVCDYCRDEHYHYCDECEEYYHNDNGMFLDEGFICDDCLSHNYFKCERCGEYIHNDNAVEVKGEYYCSFCAGIVEDEAEENEQVTILISVCGG